MADKRSSPLRVSTTSSRRSGRSRIKALGLPYRAVASLLGLSAGGLHHHTHGLRPVSKQTELLLERLEKGCLGQADGARRAEERGNRVRDR
jgi:hypothetical protein